MHLALSFKQALYAYAYIRCVINMILVMNKRAIQVTRYISVTRVNYNKKHIKAKLEANIS